MDRLERIARQDPEVNAVTSFIGRGPTRYATTVRPEQPNPAYAHLLVRVVDIVSMNEVMRRLGERFRALGGGNRTVIVSYNFV